MTSRSEAEAAKNKAVWAVRTTFHQLPTSVSVVDMPNGWGLRIGLGREPGDPRKLTDIDGVAVELSIVGTARMIG